MKVAIVLAALLALSSASAAQSSQTAHAPLPSQSRTTDWNWAGDSSRVSQSPSFAASKAICERLRGLEPPAIDWPDAASVATLNDCDSERLYYGIGMTAAPMRARQCALLEAQRGDGDDWPFSGTGMLMTIYANGVGAERNLALATSLACRMEGAAYESDSRVKHLQRFAAEGWSGHDFSYCDDITSGKAGGVCAAHDALIADAIHSARINSLSRSWTQLERRHLQRLMTAMGAYAEASGDNEVDLSGSGRVAFVIERKQDVQDDFLQLLDSLQSAALTVASLAEYQRLDAQLNSVYRQIMAIKAGTSGRIDAGTVTQPEIRAAQRVWVTYRNAWTTFVGIKYPQISANSVRAELTRRRIQFLQQFVPEPRDVALPFISKGAVEARFQPRPASAACLVKQARDIAAGVRADALFFYPNAPSGAVLHAARTAGTQTPATLPRNTK